MFRVIANGSIVADQVSFLIAQSVASHLFSEGEKVHLLEYHYSPESGISFTPCRRWNRGSREQN